MSSDKGDKNARGAAADQRATSTRENQRTREADRLFTEGEAYFHSGEFEQAAAKLTDALDRDPSHVEARLLRAQANEQLARHDEALADYDHAVAAAPDRADLLMHRASFHRKFGRLDEALADCNRAIDMQPHDLPGAYSFRASVRLQQRNYELAIEDCKRAIELKADLHQAHNNLGVALQALDDRRGAMAAYSQAIRYNQFPDAYNNRGALHVLEGDHDAALADFTAAIRLAPYHPLPLDNRGVLHLKHQRAEEAIADFTRLIELMRESLARDDETRFGPKMARIFAFRAQAHLLLGDLAAAAADIAEARRIDPASPHAAHAARKLEQAKEQKNGRRGERERGRGDIERQGTSLTTLGNL